MFKIISVLKENELQVVLGYLNTESLLYSIAEPDVVTIGAYENLRSFSPKAFQENEKKKQQGPNPRLYVSRLMQWIQYQYVQVLRRLYPNGEIFDKTEYQAEMFVKTFNWHFSKPQIYKHHFLVIYQQLKGLAKETGKARFELFKEMAKTAIEEYNILQNKGIEFEPDSDGSHIMLWLTIANLYGSERGWN